MRKKNFPLTRSRFFTWLAPLVFLGLFFFLPFARILAVGMDFTSLRASFFGETFNILLFTFGQAILSTLLTLLLGLPLAFLFARYNFPGKGILRALTAIPFMLPTVVVAAGFNALLGSNGWVNILTKNTNLPPVVFVGTLWAILAAHVFYNTTVVIRLVGNAWAALDIRLTDASRALGADPFQTLWRVTLPLLRPAIYAASLLVFLFDFTSYGVILILGGPKFVTLEVQIYIQALYMLNMPAASLLSLLQLLCTLAFSVLYNRYTNRAVAPLKPRAAWANLRAPKQRAEKLFLAGMVTVLLIFFALPLLALPIRSVTRLEAERASHSTETQAPGLTTAYYSELFLNRRDSIFHVPPVQAALNSLTYASLTVLLSLLLGFPAALALARPGRFEKAIDPFLMLPLGASAVTLGLGYIVTFNHPLPFFGNASLLTSPLLIPLAHTTIALPFVIRNLQTALATIPQRYREAAAVLGASRWQIWRTIDWPIISRATVSAGAFAFTVSLGEFGAASLLARPEYPTLPTAIFLFLSHPGPLNYGQAMAMATLLMLFTGLGIFLIERLRLPGTGEF